MLNWARIIALLQTSAPKPCHEQLKHPSLSIHLMRVCGDAVVADSRTQTLWFLLAPGKEGGLKEREGNAASTSSQPQATEGVLSLPLAPSPSSAALYPHAATLGLWQQPVFPCCWEALSPCWDLCDLPYASFLLPSACLIICLAVILFRSWEKAVGKRRAQ